MTVEWKGVGRVPEDVFHSRTTRSLEMATRVKPSGDRARHFTESVAMVRSVSPARECSDKCGAKQPCATGMALPDRIVMFFLTTDHWGGPDGKAPPLASGNSFFVCSLACPLAHPRPPRLPTPVAARERRTWRSSAHDATSRPSLDRATSVPALQSGAPSNALTSPSAGGGEAEPGSRDPLADVRVSKNGARQLGPPLPFGGRRVSWGPIS